MALVTSASKTRVKKGEINSFTPVFSNLERRREILGTRFTVIRHARIFEKCCVTVSFEIILFSDKVL